MCFLLRILRILGQIIRNQVARIQRAGKQLPYREGNKEGTERDRSLIWSWSPRFFILGKGCSMNHENWILEPLSVFQLLERKLESKVKNATEEKKVQNPNHMTMTIFSFFFFVMLFCSFLALTVFWGYSGSKKPFQRKIFTDSSMRVSTEKRMWPSMVEKYYFEDECILWTLKQGYCAKYL